MAFECQVSLRTERIFGRTSTLHICSAGGSSDSRTLVQTPSKPATTACSSSVRGSPSLAIFSA